MEARLLLVAGGTGGHIWPAVSFGKWAESEKSGVTAAYACGNRSMEMEIYKAAGVEPYVLEMEGSFVSSVSTTRKLRRFFSIFPAYRRAKDIIDEFTPSCCVLFGGYISLPFLMACKVKKTPVVIHEQNAYAGRVTRLAAKMGVEVLSGWPECKPLAPERYIRVGVPVRTFEKMSANEAWHRLGFEGTAPKSPRAVIFSGSLGSGTVKEKICDIARDKRFSSWTFIVPAVSKEAVKVAERVYLLPKIWDPSPLFAIADVSAVRGGASTLTEAACMATSPLVIPWRKAANDHQYHNAVSFLSENTGIMIESETATEDLKRKLLAIEKIRRNGALNIPRGLYNDPVGICEAFWLALVSHF